MTTPIYYTLFRRNGSGKYYAVTDSADIQLQEDLSTTDPDQVIPGASSPASEINEVVDYRFREVDVDHYMLRFPYYKDSKSNGSGGWNPVNQGASLLYYVDPTGQPSDDLLLAVHTA